MPLPIAHGLVGASVVAAIHPRPARRLFLPLLAGAVLANAADLDFLLVFALRSRAWHRGFTHSIAFALAVCLLFALSFGWRRIREAAAYGLAFASHAVLDFATTKEGGGLELLWPFSTERLRLGWWGLSEVPSRLPAAEVLKALATEAALFAPPLLLILLLRRTLAARGAAPRRG
ncbi:MAG TPA: metal-dependent hydrolase [Pyrinomonadaceae bacterium]|nr:metal-dependent hydrolase [Pyrinomonadaceae bacterium]